MNSQPDTSLKFDDGYADHIATLLLYSLEKRSFGMESMSTLAKTLGCRCMITGETWVIQDALESQPGHEQVITSALIEVIHSDIVCDLSMVEDSFALLDGLSKNDRWKTCLHNLGDAYEFAGVLLEFSFQAEVYEFRCPHKFQVVAGVALPILNTWLRPNFQLTTQPHVRPMVSAMFGEAWISLMDPADMEGGRAIHAIREHRPPFLPNLLPAHLAAVAETLPMDLS
jgi:hypothetical protein